MLNVAFTSLLSQAQWDGAKFIHWIDELSAKRIGWVGFAAIVVIVPALFLILGKWSWERRLHRWAGEQGFVLVRFHRIRDSQRMQMATDFGDWDSDWLEVFEVVVETKERAQQKGLVSFKSWFGLGPYRYRNVHWIK